MTYQEKLKDPRWQKKRLQILVRDEWQCKICMSKDKFLHVHHREYGINPWDVDDDSLVTLCSQCHEGLEKFKSSIFGSIDFQSHYKLIPELVFLLFMTAEISEDHLKELRISIESILDNYNNG